MKPKRFTLVHRLVGIVIRLMNIAAFELAGALKIAQAASADSSRPVEMHATTRIASPSRIVRNGKAYIQSPGVDHKVGMAALPTYRASNCLKNSVDRYEV